MKTIKHSLKLFVIVINLLILSNCSSDESLFPNNELRLQNDGYLPLSPNNTWIYENTLGTKQDNGSYVYSGNSFLTEHTIAKVDQVFVNNGSEKRFDYGFTPLELGRTIGGFFGSLNQIIKVGKEYINKSIIRVEKVENGIIKTHLEYKLEDQIFLTDEELNLNDIISTKTGYIGNKSENGVYIEYTITTYFKGKLNALPDNLISNEEERAFFSNFNNYIHTQDVVKITKLITKSAGGTRITGKIKQGIKSGNLVGQMDLEDVNFSGALQINGTALGIIPLNFNNAKLLGVVEGTKFSLGGLSSSLVICPSSVEIDMDSVSETSTNELLSDQDLYYRDNYWVKGVGNVKNITSPAILKAKLTLVDATTPETETILKPEDPRCIQEINRVSLTYTIRARPKDFSIVYPITIDTRSYIQTLKKYSVRKSLN